MPETTLDDPPPRDTDAVPSRAEWPSLASSPRKRALLSSDLYFRECWDDLDGIMGGSRSAALDSLALLSLKPDAVVGRRAMTVLDFARRHGFRPVAVAPFGLTRHAMRELWRYDWDVYPVDRLRFSTMWYTSGDMLLFLFEDLQPTRGVAATRRLAALKGVAAPDLRDPGSLRTALRPPNRILNFVHVCDEPGDIVREIGIFLDAAPRRVLLGDAVAHLGSDRTEDALAAVHAIEARHAQHDLDFEASLRRLRASGDVDDDVGDDLLDLASRDVKLGWDELCGKIPSLTAGRGRWDLIVAASQFLLPERTTSPRDAPSFQDCR